MTITVNYITDDPATIKNKFAKIQRRYFDPFSIRLLTDSNKYIFLEDKFNEYTRILYGDNRRLYGLEPTIEDISQNSITLLFSPGAVITKGVVIEFTTPFRIVQDIKILDRNNNDFNIVFIDYEYIKIFPPNIAKVNILPKNIIENNIHPKRFGGVLFAFKLNSQNRITEQLTDTTLLKESPIVIYNKKITITPLISKDEFEQGAEIRFLNHLKLIHSQLVDIFTYIGEFNEEISTFLKKYEFEEAKKEIHLKIEQNREELESDIRQINNKVIQTKEYFNKLISEFEKNFELFVVDTLTTINELKLNLQYLKAKEESDLKNRWYFSKEIESQTSAPLILTLDSTNYKLPDFPQYIQIFINGLKLSYLKNEYEIDIENNRVIIKSPDTFQKGDIIEIYRIK